MITPRYFEGENVAIDFASIRSPPVVRQNRLPSIVTLPAARTELLPTSSRPAPAAASSFESYATVFLPRTTP
jgi:hypothetical protein